MATGDVLAAFNAWAADNGARTPLATGCGVYATAAAPADAVAAHIPSSLFLCRSNVLRESAIAVLEASLAPALPSDRLYILIYLLWARRFMPSPYLHALPASFDTPVFLTPGSAAHRLLSGTGLDDAADAKLAALARELKVLDPALQCLAVPGSNNQPAVSLDDLKWADACLWSRVMSFASASESASESASTPSATEDDLHVVPFIDFCNHDLAPNARWRLVHDANDSMRVAGMDLVLTRPVSAGDEICITYGTDKPSAELLFLHGFAIPEHTLHTVTVPPPFVEMGMLAAAGDDGDEGETGEERHEEDGAETDDDNDVDVMGLYRKQMRQLAESALADKQALMRELGLPTMISIAPAQVPDTTADADAAAAAAADAVKTKTDGDDEDEPVFTNPTQGILSNDTLLTLYICVLTAEDGFGRVEVPTDHDAADTAAKQEDEPQTVFHLYGQLLMPLTKEKLAQTIAALPHADVLALRVWTVLIDVLGYHLAMLAPDEDAEQQASGGGDHPILASLMVVREGQAGTLAKALDVFASLQDTYAQLPVVTAYLEQMQMDDQPKDEEDGDDHADSHADGHTSA
ncbi:hypothetical protein BC831DRAFT_452010 [Entophlyctis helioformis]|nr:hypothetical protein BC831DRAFT_452010 [Entophlyctis helioformis]